MKPHEIAARLEKEVADFENRILPGRLREIEAKYEQRRAAKELPKANAAKAGK